MQTIEDMDLRSLRILIVDDQEANVRLIEFILDAAGFQQYAHTTDSREVLPLCWNFQPDLLLLDLQMPHYDGFAVMARLARALPGPASLPILVLTADINAETKKRALAAGANDFLSKPLDAVEVVLRIKNLLRTRWLYSELRRSYDTLEEKVRERTAELAAAELQILDRLAVATEYRDDATGQHTERVAKLSAMIARGLGQNQDEVELLRTAAKLHDVGKIGLPDRILTKQGRLTAEEFEVVKSHTTIGANILGQSNFLILQLAREIAISHHERWDGSGYPSGLRGDAIPLSGRVVAIADVFDALTHDRPYKKEWPLEDAVAEMKRSSGRQFDPDLVNVFLTELKAEGLNNLSKRLHRGKGAPKPCGEPERAARRQSVELPCFPRNPANAV